MKLAFCLFKYFPYGGLQRDFMRIAEACTKRGHTVHIYAGSWEGPIHPQFQLHIVNVTAWQNHARNQQFAELVKHELDQNDYDVVIGFNKMPYLDVYYAADVCYQARIHHTRSWWYRLLPRYKQQLAFEKAIFQSGNQTQILTISPLQQSEFTSYYQTEAERIHLLPPGIAKDRIAPLHAHEIRQSVRDQYQLTNQDHLLLMVGSGFKTKGVDRAIRALAALPAALKERTYLFIIGEGNARSFLKLAALHHVAEKINFLGGRPDVPNFLLAADLLVHTAYHENTGTVLLEALAAGLPVLTWAGCGYASYITKANAGCVLGSPFSQSECNLALEKMLLSEDKASWQQNGIAFAKNEDIYSLPEKAADIIESVVVERSTVIPACAGMTGVGATMTVESARMIVVAPELKKYLSSSIPIFDQLLNLTGTRFREQKGRITERITLGDKSYFIKKHLGIGWKEIFKNIFQGRVPVMSAKNEWYALKKLHSAGIKAPAVMAYGYSGKNPAHLKSMILLEDLTPTLSLEDITKTWLTFPPAFAFKRAIIMEVANITGKLHQNGINHRDLYICHFLLNTLHEVGLDIPSLYLIDLHRAQIRKKIPKRWIIKDLAALYFSSKNIGLTERDLLRFIKIYCAATNRTYASEFKFWEKVKKRGEQLYREHA